ncbi:rRNA methylase [Nitrincola lacisaponensis]|uniref:rRNA methylase n=1 Tax=Nitrincola lacisaponensis TaxID=267850 RepID=A0A063Y1I3_9GAMM|nr:RNA methyltransferase [Nitrincola lacisaponensis]KDE38990.1 rRNA methylase [Nitrincola lacisaponensis]
MKLDLVKKLQQKKYRQSLGYCLVEGEHLILELQRAATTHTALQASCLYVTERYADWQSPFETHLISDKQMASISDTETPQGILARVPLAALQTPGSGTETAIYLHEIQDPGNLGTILRTLGWFGGFRCLLSPGSVDPFNPKVIRASMGAIFHVPLELDVPLTSLSSRFSRIGCLDMQGHSLTSEAFQSIDCYLFGNEARGVPPDALQTLNAQAFTIPGAGLIESLNLASAVNICIYERRR